MQETKKSSVLIIVLCLFIPIFDTKNFTSRKRDLRTEYLSLYRQTFCWPSSLSVWEFLHRNLSQYNCSAPLILEGELGFTPAVGHYPYNTFQDDPMGPSPSMDLKRFWSLVPDSESCSSTVSYFMLIPGADIPFHCRGGQYMVKFQSVMRGHEKIAFTRASINC